MEGNINAMSFLGMYQNKSENMTAYSLFTEHEAPLEIGTGSFFTFLPLRISIIIKNYIDYYHGGLSELEFEGYTMYTLSCAQELLEYNRIGFKV
mmetsp:Transcript_3422/g.5800  ORF Transcript_3422/g.5800 Transcript_3422/m.5800 type:complete len:94 (+) Transcript_3422:729-1010(+)